MRAACLMTTRGGCGSQLLARGATGRRCGERRAPERLGAMREQLDQGRLIAPLFDTMRFTRNLEAAYTQMHARHHAGRAPDHITITPDPS